MENRKKCEKLVKDFRIKHAVEGEDENLIVTLHLMNSHLIDIHTSLEQSSRSGNDHGIDGWFYEKDKGILFIYQSKLSESKTSVIKGLNDFLEAKNWLEKIIMEGCVDNIPTNPCLYNLYMELASSKEHIKKINFVLISLFNVNELEDKPEYDDIKRSLINSHLNKFMVENGGKIDLRLEEYNFDTSLPVSYRTYEITKIEDSRMSLRKTCHLDLSYIPLYNLVDLYRRKGDILFNKNIRLSIINTKETKERLVHPMENTFDMICSGKVNPNIFPFYHVGITIAATINTSEKPNLLSLEEPSIINGCQTITIADSYLRNLEKKKNDKYIKRFKDIKVIAKVVIGTTDDELREITNSNNRQIPTENWQLFSNDPVHIEIESALKDVGIFYERQKGRFNAFMKRTDFAKSYINTGNSYIGIVDLGQVICLSRRNLQWAAKPSEMFLNKERHDSVFDRSIPNYYTDIVYTINSFKAIKRALYKYLDLAAHSNDVTQKIFSSPIVKTSMYYVAMIYFYQAKGKYSLRQEFSTDLYKIANPRFVPEVESFYSKVITKTKNWYLQESKQFKNEVSSKKREEFLDKLCLEMGIDLKDGNIPFTEKSIDWKDYEDD